MPQLGFGLLAFGLVLGCSNPTRPTDGRTASRNTCRTCPVCVQVLGSGGPIPDDDRASSAYVLWLDGHARLLVDAGGGTFLRFGEAGASLNDLDAVALSHLHADHSADLVALLKGGYFIKRRRPLPLIGPSGNDGFPSTDAFLRSLLAPRDGPFRYLSGYLDGDRGWFGVPVTVGDATRKNPRVLFEGPRFRLSAVGVHHGHVPALGYRVETAGKVIVFGGDHGRGSDAFAQLAKGADLLIMHHAVPEGVEESLNELHRTPSQIGEAAAAAGADVLVLSHHMKRAIERKDEGRELIEARYDGTVEFADDLDCYRVP